ncbi:MAG TPA: deoxyguanosinetriphosphate triphosphohydrolase [Pseudonocardia sp.]|uniref:deoxyguanosinetriphosphate triphosphohydrolase n=1 Tax=Pseudonocardia sp. TaxID=60912 RepID=UPI002CD10D46|nr:deoxyguanosinetriphosphate triphosphohydrolase [Pseudonocardia sp.]HTF46839.1 deoxyguanosinetriphosphate triphosphohydrolase [Pseudonocardia sp.]
MSLGYPYTEHDQARMLPERPKRSALGGQVREHRGAFARDRARVLHSAALRRLAGKTQVVGPGEGAEITGMPRTRLTHSLEVAQIGRAIAEELGADPDVVDTAGLAHDIGHPPFGHNGEWALDRAAARCGGFEGNAQTLRTLVRLEPKIVGGGLNLSRASLDASCKYPWPAGKAAATGRAKDGRKYGVYAEDLPAFEWLRDGAPSGRRCLEAQVMDWSDDVAYSVHDVEDGILAGRITLAALADPTERSALAALAAESFGADRAACEAAGDRLLGLPVVASARELGPHSGSAGQVALKRLTSELVNRFAAAAVDATRAAHGYGPLGRYRADLLVPAPVAAEVALLKAVAVRYVMADPVRLRLQADQREVLLELVEAIAAGAPDTLAGPLREDWEAAPNDLARWRVVIDQVATLTDQQAYAWHTRLVPGRSTQ